MIKRISKYFNIKKLKHYLLLSFLLITCIVLLSKFNLTLSRYESNTEINIDPSIAFFITDVTSEDNSIKLTDILPSDTPYYYSFSVSNFNDTGKSNVDLDYNMELITTTNLPLTFKLYKGSTNSSDIISSNTVSQDDNSVYYRHLTVNDKYNLYYANKTTDKYILEVTFPSTYKNHPELYEGVIELIEIKINAYQMM